MLKRFLSVCQVTSLFPGNTYVIRFFHQDRTYMKTHIGELTSLATALCWTIAVTAFESAGKRAGTLPVNIIRLVLSVGLLSIYTMIFRGSPLPMDATGRVWLWLSLSGLAGFVLGDLLLFKALMIVGSRISMLIYSSVPVITAVFGLLWLNETLSLTDITGIALTLLGISLVILVRHPEQKGLSLSHPLTGILYALGGSIGQAAGLILGKFGSGEYDAFAATQIRTFAGILGFALIITLAGRWKPVGITLKDGKNFRTIMIGSFFGPFLGVSLSLFSVQRTATGIASAIMAIIPVLLIPVAIIYFKEKIMFKEVIGALIAVAGVAVLLLT